MARAGELWLMHFVTSRWDAPEYGPPGDDHLRADEPVETVESCALWLLNLEGEAR